MLKLGRWSSSMPRLAARALPTSPQPTAFRAYRAGRWRSHQSSSPLYEEARPEPSWQYQPNGPSGGRVLFIRPILWSLAFSGGVYYLSANSFADHRERMRQRSWSYFNVLGLGGTGSVDDEDDRVWAMMNDPEVQRLVGRGHSVFSEPHAKTIRRIANLPGWVPREMKRSMVACSDSWYRMSPGKRVVYTIAGINAVVFAMWQVPRLMPKMTKYFLHDPRTGRAYTLLTSTFSHREIWHFAFNNIALVSFGAAVADRMGAEQFTAFYLSAGVISSLANHLLSPLRPLLILPALGASGAVYAVVGATMMYYPNSQIALIFLPFLPFTISQAFPLLMAYDLAGAVLGWSTFAHWAHLGGGAFGIAYVKWGEKWWRELVKTVEARRQK